MKRRIFQAFTAIFALIALAAAIWFYVDNRQRYLSYYWEASSGDRRDVCIGREPGRIVLSYGDEPSGFPWWPMPGLNALKQSRFEVAPIKKVFSNPYSSQDVRHSVHVMGFRYYQLAIPSDFFFQGRTPPVFQCIYVLNVPSWAVVVLPLLIAAIFWQRSRIRIPNTCHACEYNLTGNTSGICPECGTAISH